jgi:hypothetical protein
MMVHSPRFVIPAKAGTPLLFRHRKGSGAPAFAGVTKVVMK